MRTKGGKIWGRRPILYAELVRALIASLVVFGVPITPEQNSMLIVLSSAFLALVTNAYVEPNTPSYVTPRKDRP